ncbi:helix-turn-helix domain-containing protein [Nocardia wallacei]|uniref:helix-turn-helix domain-containing protein n=1 Tax=Nocardia wallacei TaxID=480035 RepID=UPI002456A5A5|nr:helix-turn-helix domain-containing protein [Nocardia wallacei]
MDPATAVTTRVVDYHERADYWTELVDANQCRLAYEFTDRADFRGHIRLRRTEGYQLVGWSSDAVTYIRGAKHIRADPDDDYRLIVPLTRPVTIGSADEQGTLVPGSTALVSIDRPFSLSLPEGTRGLIITIPRQEIRHRLHRTAPPAQPLDLTTGLGRVAAGIIGSLYDESATLTDREFDAVSERLVDLLCMQILGDPGSAATRLAAVESAARRYIHGHAGDRDLTVARLAEALGWSVRQIQLAFRATGTSASEVIREERLRLARDRLRNPAYRQRSVSAIASDLGFDSVSSFTKAFHRRFGATPGRFREDPDGGGE